MAQLALAILVLAVLLTFAVLARRAGQTRASWAFIALAVLISAAFSYVGWRTWQAPPQLDPAQVVIELGSANVTGAGWRLTGFVSNTGDSDVASLVVRAQVKDCREEPCALLDEREFSLLLNVPAGQRYPFRQALHDIAVPADLATPQWSLEVVRVLGYPAAQR